MEPSNRQGFLLAMNVPLRIISNKAPSAAPALEANQRPAGTKVHFTSGQTVFLSGDPADRIYEVTDGVLMVFKMLSDGRRQIAEVLPPGWLGGFATDGHYDCSCEALTDATATAYTRAEFDASQLLSNRLQHQTEEQLCALHEQTLNLGRKDAEERLATFLMRFVPGRGRLGCVGPKYPNDTARVHVPMSRAEMADYLGLTLETVSRMITALARRGLIQVGPKQGEIYVNDVCKLCAIAKTGHNE
jgi:CRP-like cAMP-binding protein